MTYIFDLDGTLIDSNGLWEQVDRAFLGRRGLSPTREYLETVGRSIFPVAAEYTKNAFALPDSPEDIMAEWVALARDYYARHVELKPGALALLEKLRAEGAPLAMFTACRPELCRLVLERYGLAAGCCGHTPAVTVHLGPTPEKQGAAVYLGPDCAAHQQVTYAAPGLGPWPVTEQLLAALTAAERWEPSEIHVVSVTSRA